MEKTQTTKKYNFLMMAGATLATVLTFSVAAPSATAFASENDTPTYTVGQTVGGSGQTVTVLDGYADFNGIDPDNPVLVPVNNADYVAPNLTDDDVDAALSYALRVTNNGTFDPDNSGVDTRGAVSYAAKLAKVIVNNKKLILDTVEQVSGKAMRNKVSKAINPILDKMEVLSKKDDLITSTLKQMLANALRSAKVPSGAADTIALLVVEGAKFFV